MNDFSLRLFIGALVILGIWTLFRKEMLLGWVAERLGERLHDEWLKPFYLCPPCMSSIWGTLIWFSLGGEFSIMWPIYLLALCGLLKLIVCNILCE